MYDQRGPSRSVTTSFGIRYSSRDDVVFYTRSVESKHYIGLIGRLQKPLKPDSSIRCPRFLHTRCSRAFEKFRRWAASYEEVKVLPSDCMSIATYLDALLQSNFSFSALESALYDIRWAHNLYGFPILVILKSLRVLWRRPEVSLNQSLTKSLLLHVWHRRFVRRLRQSTLIYQMYRGCYVCYGKRRFRRLNELSFLRFCDVKFCNGSCVEL